MKTLILSIISITITLASYGTSSNYGGNTTYHSFGNGITAHQATTVVIQLIIVIAME